MSTWTTTQYCFYIPQKFYYIQQNTKLEGMISRDSTNNDTK